MAFFILLPLSLLIAYGVVTTLRNLFFHPLSNTPGPFLARISSLPSFYHACKGDRHVWIWQNFQIYGDEFRAAPNMILFNSPRAFTDIYGYRSNITRSAFYRAFRRHKDDVHTLNSTDPAMHARRRKLLNLAFTEQSLKAASPLIAKHIDRWVQLLVDAPTDTSNVSEKGEGSTADWSQPRNMAATMDHLVFDILGELCFGESFNTKEPGENKLKNVPHLMLNQVILGYKLGKSPILNLLLYLRPRGLNKLLESLRQQEIKEYIAFIEGSVDKRIAAHKTGSSSASSKDIFHFLLTAIDPDTNLPAFTDRNHLLAETRLLALAGTDTTATTLCGVFFYLSRNPTVLAKLTAEIRSTFSSGEEIVLGAKLSQCKYLRACIDETLRLAHPAPGELPREVLPGGAVIDGKHYPAGTIVGCSSWAMGRDERVYGDANVFRPERWILSDDPDHPNPSAEVLKLKRAFHPFSIGSENCVGQNVALLELLMTTAKTVWAMDFSAVPGESVGEGRPELGWGQRSPKHYVVKDAYLCVKDGPIIQFRPRSE